jgi:hypothetical protein
VSLKSEALSISRKFLYFQNNLQVSQYYDAEQFSRS